MPEEYFLQIVGPRVSPAAASWESGLPLEGGTTAPFIVDRGWVGPAGTYIEEWSIRREGKILYRHPPAYIQVRGQQSVRRFSDTVRTPLVLEPGTYDICFVVERYLMGSITVEAAPLESLSVKPAPLPAPPAPAAGEPAPRPPAAKSTGAPQPPAARVPAAGAPAYTGEDPSTVRERVFREELAKGSDPRVAEARAKSAEMRAKKAAAAVAATPAADAPVAAAPATAPGVPAAAANGAAAEPAAPAAKAPPSPLLPGAPPGGGGFTAEQAAVARTLVYNEAITKGLPVEVAEAQAKAAEIRARRGVWWRPDW